jgi:hypothetical protein
VSIVIVGAGPNLGASIARRFGREGLPVGLVARDASKLEALAADLAQSGITADFAPADIRDAPGLSSAIAALGERLGPAEVLEYSPLPARDYMNPILETTVDDVRGPLEFTTGGAAIRPNPIRAGAGISFAGEVAYARMLQRTWRRVESTSRTRRSAGASAAVRTTTLRMWPRSCGASTPSAASSRYGSGSTESPEGPMMRLTIVFDRAPLSASPVNSEAARDFVALLPLTLTMNDLFGREKFGHLPRPLTSEGPRTHTYSVGDIAYWSPGPDVAIFYRHDGR